MYMSAEKPKRLQQATSTKTKSTRPGHHGERHDVSATLQLQRMLGNQAGGGRPAGRVGVLQAKLAVNRPGDQYEQEADRVADRVMRMEATDVARTAPPAIQRLEAGYDGGVAPGHLQRLCAECEEETVQRKSSPVSDGALQGSRRAETLVDAVRGGEPLTREQRAFFEPRFGADFSHVRVHTGDSADAAARSIGAYAYTRGSDIVFRGDQYRPSTSAGRHMLAHELTHVVQQGAAPRAHEARGGEMGERAADKGPAHAGAAGAMVQCWPGDGMTPPGDCGWARYLLLRGSVETAKAVVSSLGGCSPDDGCTLLATKIAAISAEIAARLALDTTCFRGGDEGHRQQVQDKVNMMNRCFRFFDGSNCPPELVAAMAVVVEAAREAIAAAAIAVTLALIVALIAAIIALAEAIAAALAAAAEGAAAAAAVAAVIALLVAIKEEITES